MIDRAAVSHDIPNAHDASTGVASVYPRSITSFNLQGETPWTHTVVQMGPNKEDTYLSIYPESHFHPPMLHSEVVLDPSDYAPQVHAIAVNTHLMVRSKVGLATALELDQYPYTEVKIPVTTEQWQKANAYAMHVAEQAKQGRVHYSIFKPFGISCAEANQQVLEIVTENNPKEAALVRSSWPERMSGITWPQATHNRAKKLAEVRGRVFQPQSDQQGTVTASIGLSFFSRPMMTAADSLTMKGLEVEQLTYF